VKIEDPLFLSLSLSLVIDRLGLTLGNAREKSIVMKLQYLF